MWCSDARMPASARNRSTRSRSRREVGAQHLDRDRAAEAEVLAAIDDAHRAARQLVDDAVRAAERSCPPRASRCRRRRRSSSSALVGGDDADVADRRGAQRAVAARERRLAAALAARDLGRSPRGPGPDRASSSSSLIGSLWMRWISLRTTSDALRRRSAPTSSTASSSPPSRPIGSLPRTVARTRAAICASTSSPALWPCSRLIRRRPTMSNSASVSFSLRRAAAATSCAIVCSNAPRVIAPVSGSCRLAASRRSPSATIRRWLVSHDSSRVSRAAIALRSVRSAAENRRADVGDDRDEAGDLRRRRAQRIGDHRARLAAADDHGAGRRGGDPRGRRDLRAIAVDRGRRAPRRRHLRRRRATTRCSRAR